MVIHKNILSCSCTIIVTLHTLHKMIAMIQLNLDQSMLALEFIEAFIGASNSGIMICSC